MKHNLAKIDLLKILHDLKCPISAYDTIVHWATHDIAKFIKCCKNQSDRTFPNATYTLGICSTAKMKGKEKFASLFYLSFYVHN